MNQHQSIEELTTELNAVKTSLSETQQRLQESTAMVSALIQTQTQFDALLHNSNDGLILLDRDGKIEKFNTVAETIFCTTEPEQMGKSIEHLFSWPHNHPRGIIDYLLETSKTKNINQNPIQGIQSNHQKIPLRVSLSIVNQKQDDLILFAEDPIKESLQTTNKHNKIMCIINDLTQEIALNLHIQRQTLDLIKTNEQLEQEIEKHKLTAIELKQAKNAAIKANKLKSSFLTNMSHELRTPMHGILSYANMGQKRIERSSPEKNLKYFSNIKISGDRLLKLLNNLLDLAKLESGKMEMDYISTDLHSIVAKCIVEQQTRLKELKQKIIADKNNIAGKGFFDAAKIAQVITNFISNAIKFTPKDSDINYIIKQSEIGVGAIKVPALLFSIRDHGNGIPAGELEIVFDKFVQSSNTTVATTKGTGLGLPICKEIIELHDGKIWAENHPEGGAIFSFIIPLSPNKLIT